MKQSVLICPGVKYSLLGLLKNACDAEVRRHRDNAEQIRAIVEV